MSYPCGCGQTFPTYGNVTAGTCATTITSDLYNTLGGSAVLKILGVVPGSTTQSFLTGSPGFVMADPATPGAFKVVASPALQLPIQNPSSGGTFPLPSGFQFLMTASGSNPQTWQYVAAPSSGRYMLQSYNGQWLPVDAGQIPGINQVASSADVWAKGDLLALGMVSGQAVVRKLAVNAGRVIVGDTTGGVAGYQSLADSAPLTHPLAKITDTTRIYKIRGIDVNGGDVATGFPIATTTGGDPTTDFDQLGYSPLKGLLMRAPEQAFYQNINAANGTDTPGNSYGMLAGTHGSGASRNFNYKNVRVSFSAYFSNSVASSSLQFAVFRDGQYVTGSERETENSQVVILEFVDTNVLPGAHTYDIRYKRSSGSGALTIRNSSFIVRTLD